MKDNITNNVWVGVHGDGKNLVTASGTLLENTGYNQFFYPSSIGKNTNTNICLVFSFEHEMHSGLILADCGRKKESYICEK